MALGTYDGKDTDDALIFPGISAERDEEALAAGFVIAVTSLIILLEISMIALRICNIGLLNQKIKHFLLTVRPSIIVFHKHECAYTLSRYRVATYRYNDLLVGISNPVLCIHAISHCASYTSLEWY